MEQYLWKRLIAHGFFCGTKITTFIWRKRSTVPYIVSVCCLVVKFIPCILTGQEPWKHLTYIIVPGRWPLSFQWSHIYFFKLSFITTWKATRQKKMLTLNSALATWRFFKINEFSVQNGRQCRTSSKLICKDFAEGDVVRGISIPNPRKPTLDLGAGQNIMINSFGFFDRQGCNLLHFKSHREPSPVRVRVVQSSHMVHAPFKAQAVQNGS